MPIKPEKALAVAPNHALLLKAALFEAPRCFEAWEAWKEQTKGRAIDEPSKRIFPLLYSSLTAKGVKDPALEALKPWYEQSRAKNQVLIGLLPGLEKRFRAERVDMMLIKGVAMIAAYYDDPAARPLGDLDILVREPSFAHGFRVLQQDGWVPFVQSIRVKVLDSRFTHAVQFYRAGPLSIDLHCHTLAELCAPRIDDGVWERSTVRSLSRTSLRVPHAEDLLLIACVHGMRPRAEVDLRWIADGLTLYSKPIDWDRLASEAIAGGLGGLLGKALHLLQSEFAASPPPGILERLDRAGIDSRVQLIHEVLEDWEDKPFAKLRAHWAQMGLGTGSNGVVRRLATLPAYLRYWCQAEALWKVPWVLLKKGFRRIGFYLGFFDYYGEVKDFLRQAGKTSTKTQ